MIALLYSFVYFQVTVASNFCQVQGNFVEELPNAINTNNKEASGLVLNSQKNYFFTISDSPESNPLIFVTTNTENPSSTATIKITGIQNAAFNGGYGDWESVATYPCSTNPSQQCILVGDIGHNKVRNKGGVFRSSTQSVRFIEVEEPSATELSSSQVLEKPGKVYSFSYPNGARYDAEAMVVKDNRLFVITKNSLSHTYSHMFEVPSLSDGVELIERAIFKVSYSEVTGAASSPGYLILRTYIGLNFYKWDSLCDDSVRKSKVYQSIDFLERNHGLQEAIEYNSGFIYLAGEGEYTLYRMPCQPAGTPILSPVFTKQCLDDYGGDSQVGATSSTCWNTPTMFVLVMVGMAYWFK